MTPAPTYARIAREGLWDNNPGLVQLLGLCPLLAVSTTLVHALALGAATTLVVTGSNVTVSLIRHAVQPEIRIPVFVLVIASLVTVVELLMNAFFHDLYLILGIFVPLIVTNCAILGRAEAFASRTTPGPAAFDGLMTGLGFTGVLATLGGFREIVGHGSLLRNAELLFGDEGAGLGLQILPADGGFLLALLPPGAFIALGLLLAVKNIVDHHRAARAALAAGQRRPRTEPVPTARGAAMTRSGAPGPGDAPTTATREPA